MAEKVKDGYLNATALLEELVMKGVPFREAHHQVGLLVLEALEKGCSLNELMKEDDHGLSSLG